MYSLSSFCQGATRCRHIGEDREYQVDREHLTGGGHGNPLQDFCLENPHGQRSLVGKESKESMGCKESDMTE